MRLERRRADRSTVELHYPNDDAWLATVGEKTLADYRARDLDPVELLGTSDAIEIGKAVKGWLVDFMTAGDVVVVLVEGNRAVEAVRKLIGGTLPVSAAPGTIRGDYSTDSPEAANRELRPVRNLIHASGDVAEANREIGLWFD